MSTRPFVPEKNQEQSDDEVFIDTDWPAKPLENPASTKMAQRAVCERVIRTTDHTSNNIDLILAADPTPRRLS